MTDTVGTTVKRLFDIVSAGFGLVLTAPIIALAVIAVRWESPGNPIFVQTRVGRHRGHFNCLKLRTMYTGTANLPSHLTPANAVTPLGARLRRWKIDELPQLYNVLVGDMSLVGPRPCLPTQTALVEARDKRGVYAVRPGITGLAQVQGVDMSDPERLADLDSTYVQDMTFIGDLKILLATISGSGTNVDRVRH